MLRYRQVIRANLRWESVSLDTGLLRIETEKTGTVVLLPMYSDFAQWLAGRPREIGPRVGQEASQLEVMVSRLSFVQSSRLRTSLVAL
jgi:hypothetical protein